MQMDLFAFFRSTFSMYLINMAFILKTITTFAMKIFIYFQLEVKFVFAVLKFILSYFYFVKMDFESF